MAQKVPSEIAKKAAVRVVINDVSGKNDDRFQKNMYGIGPGPIDKDRSVVIPKLKVANAYSLASALARAAAAQDKKKR